MYIVFNYIFVDEIFSIIPGSMCRKKNITDYLTPTQIDLMEYHKYMIREEFFCINVDSDFKSKMYSNCVSPEIIKYISNTIDIFIRKEKIENLNKLGCI